MNISNDRQTWLRIGAKQGAKWGLLLAFAYIVWMTFVVVTGSPYPSPTSFPEWVNNNSSPYNLGEKYSHLLFGFVILGPIVIGVGSAIGIIPALIVGAASGVALGGILSHPAIRPYPNGRAIASAIFGGWVTLIGNIILYLLVLHTSQDPSYALISLVHFLGMPSLVYIGVCLIFSQQLPLWVERTHIKERPIVLTPSLQP